MNNQPTAIEYLAQEVTRLSIEKAYLQEALSAERAKNAELEEQLTTLSKKGDK